MNDGMVRSKENLAYGLMCLGALGLALLHLLLFRDLHGLHSIDGNFVVLEKEKASDDVSLG